MARRWDDRIFAPFLLTSTVRVFSLNVRPRSSLPLMMIGMDSGMRADRRIGTASTAASGRSRTGETQASTFWIGDPGIETPYGYVPSDAVPLPGTCDSCFSRSSNATKRCPRFLPFPNEPRKCHSNNYRRPCLFLKSIMTYLYNDIA